MFPLRAMGRGYAVASDVAWQRTSYWLLYAALIGVTLVAWVVGSWYGVGWSAPVIGTGLVMWYAATAAVDRRLRRKQGGEPLTWMTSLRLQVRAWSTVFLGTQVLTLSLLFWLSLLENNPMFLGLSQKVFAILVFLPQLALYIALLMLKLVDEHRTHD
ncbi:hypothetical protein V5738_05200 [Salinisphaera sp. SPP-AMP-43]|uniref:hypothetical protein n=1 Tax=Salinisphaera sp. SPP-AMP-43 TaxID=3121288 RepID=UPI003C6E8279